MKNAPVASATPFQPRRRFVNVVLLAVVLLAVGGLLLLYMWYGGEPAHEALEGEVVDVGPVTFTVSIFRWFGLQFDNRRVLILSVGLGNTSDTKIVRYNSWRYRSGLLFGKNGVYMEDNLGNRYYQFTDNFPFVAVDNWCDLRPGEKCSDVLVFPEPLPNAEYLLLGLPHRNFGERGCTVFKLPLDKFHELYLDKFLDR
jgi:hypothetical protein